MSGGAPAAEGVRPAAGAPVATRRWVALGDSFTAGTIPGEPSWPELVCARLAPRAELELHNLARVGAPMSAVEHEQLPAALALEPELVTVIGGGNDVIRRVRPDLGDFAARLARVLLRLRARLPGTHLLTATYPPIAGHAVRPRTRRRIGEGLAALNEIVRETAAAGGVRCVELDRHPGREDASNYAADGIHPSPAGHRVAAATVGAAIAREIGLDPSDDDEEERDGH